MKPKIDKFVFTMPAGGGGGGGFGGFGGGGVNRTKINPDLIRILSEDNEALDDPKAPKPSFWYRARLWLSEQLLDLSDWLDPGPISNEHADFAERRYGLPPSAWRRLANGFKPGGCDQGVRETSFDRLKVDDYDVLVALQSGGFDFQIAGADLCDLAMRLRLIRSEAETDGRVAMIFDEPIDHWIGLVESAITHRSTPQA